MTDKEQAIEYIKGYRKLDEELYNKAPKGTVSSNTTKKCLEFWDMAIQALSQEPKTGYLIRWYEIIEREHLAIHDPHCKCSECDREYDPYSASLFNYCPNCGAKMQEVKE